MNEIEKYQGFKAELAIAETFEEIKFIENKAAAVAEFARRDKVGYEEQTKWGTFRIEVESKKGEWLDERFPAFTGKKIIGSPNGTLKSEGITKKESTNARYIALNPEIVKDVIEKMKTNKIVPTPTNVASQVKQIANKIDAIAKIESIEVKEAKELRGEYDVIVIDPPWPMEKIERDVRPNQVAFDYPVMQESELSEMKLPTTNDCHVWVWTTHKFLPMALRLIEKWGLKYVCTFTWHKPGGFQPVGLPQYNCEFALYARKGTPKFIDTRAFNTCFNAPRGAHSEKPDEFYEVVRRVTAGRRVDMFNRRLIDGFDTWGKEAQHG
ncbi:MAG: MT-A70 family methyltransferase [Bacteroidales bacterium]